MKIMKVKALRVTDVNMYIKNILARDPILSNIQVEGEIFNFKWHSSGHIYFSLKDDKSRIKTVMFKQNTSNLLIEPKEGMKVVVEGYISVYERDGNYQLYANNIFLKGQGELYLEFDKLKKKLESKGYFDEESKKPLPYMPTRIGLVTSDTGAAVRDIISVIKRRMPFAEIVLYPALVQGIYAAKDLKKGIETLEQMECIDIIIIGRGGGSIEELWAFNNEELAKTIFKSKVPIVSAVGHETDFTICDFVADLRVPTPSVAGEMVVPDCMLEKQKIISMRKQLFQAIDYMLDRERNMIKMQDIKQAISSIALKLKTENKSIETLMEKNIETMDRELQNQRNSIEKLANLADAYSPLKTLARGYSVVQSKEGKAIKSINDLKIEEDVNIIFEDGEAKARVLELKNAMK